MQRNGWAIEWETKRRHRRTGRPFIERFTSENIRDVEEKRRTLREKGYKVSKIQQCIF